MSYLTSVLAQSAGSSISGGETLLIILYGNIPDIDFFTGMLNGKTGEKHHQNITHTPLGVMLIWILSVMIFRFERQITFLLLASALLHLALDDLPYWLMKAGIIKERINPQINWLYPLSGFHKIRVETDNLRVLKAYFLNGSHVFKLEILLIAFAFAVFLLRNRFLSLNILKLF